MATIEQLMTFDPRTYSEAERTQVKEHVAARIAALQAQIQDAQRPEDAPPPTSTALEGTDKAVVDEFNAFRKEKEGGKAPEEEKGILDTIGGALSSAGSYIAEEVTGAASMIANDPLKAFSILTKPVANGAIKAVNETVQTSYAIAEALGKEESKAIQIPKFSDEDYKNVGTAKFTETAAQFITGLVGASKLLKPIKVIGTTGQFAKSMVQGAIADFTVMDAHEKKLIDMMEMDSDFGKAAQAYLGANPDDSELLGKTKNVVEGMLLGFLTEAGVRGAKAMTGMVMDGIDAIKSSRIAKTAGRQLDAVDDVVTAQPRGVEVKPDEGLAQSQKVQEIQFDLDSNLQRYADDPKMQNEFAARKHKEMEAIWEKRETRALSKETEYKLIEATAQAQDLNVKNLEGMVDGTEEGAELLARVRALSPDKMSLDEFQRLAAVARSTPTTEGMMPGLRTTLRGGKSGLPSTKVTGPIEVAEERVLELLNRAGEPQKEAARAARFREAYEINKIVKERQFAQSTNLGHYDDAWEFTKVSDTTSTRLRREAEVDIATGNAKRHLEPSVREVEKSAGKMDKESLKVAAKAVRDESEEFVAKATLQADREIADQIASETKSIQRQLAESGLGAGIGGAVGYEQGGMEGAFYGMVVGGGLPWAAGKTYKKVGTMLDGAGSRITDMFGAGISRPIHKLGVMGSNGKVFGRMMRSVELNIDQKVGRYVQEITHRMSGLSKEEATAIQSVMRGSQKASSKAQQQVVDLIKKDFDNVLKEAVDAKVMTKEAADDLLKKGGYWPREFDEALLATSHGRKVWIDTFTNARWSSKEGIENALEHVLHGEKSNLGQFITRTKDGYTMTKEGAAKLLDNRAIARAKVRSGHLEKARKIHVENEEILAPLLVKDPKVVLTQYFYDVTKRIEMAKAFGANDEVAEAFFRSIEHTNDIRNADFARNVYYKMAGDSRSSVVAQNLRMHHKTKEILGQLDALQTLKLSMAQTINAGQVLVNTPTYLSKHVNPAKSLKLTVKGFVKSLGKEGGDFAARAGAANETTLMEITGEAMVQHSIFGRDLTTIPYVGKVLTPFEYLNNPTKFLQITGFLGVEKFNRRFAANIGKAYFEDLMARKVKMEAAEAAGKAVNKKAALKLKRALDEMNIPWNKSAKEITEQDANWFAERTALALSDTVNYRNVATQLPYLWGSPWARIFRKFRTFTFHHGAFVKENVIKPAARDGNFGPLMSYLAVGTPVGMTVLEFKQWVTGDDSDLTQTEQYVRGMSAVGGMGILQDTLTNFGSAYGGRVAGMAGPAVGDAYRIYQDIGKVGEGKLTAVQAAKRAGLHSFGGIPTFGVLPSKKEMLEELRINHMKKRELKRERKVERE